MRRTLLLAAAAAISCRTPAPPPAPPAEPGIDASIVDRAVSPCDDFYAFACGGWLARTEIPADQAVWSRSFMEIRERNRAQLRAIAEQAAAGGLGPQDRHADKVGDYWAACMDEQAVESRGTEDLRAAWAELDAVKDPRSIGLAVARLHAQGVWPIFRLASDQDAKDATQVIGVVWQGGLTLPDRDYYLAGDAKRVEIRERYEAHLARMLALAGVPAKQARAEAAAVLGLEKRMAQAHWTRTELRDPARIYNRLDLAGLQRAAPRFPWKAYLEALGHGDLTAFSATTPAYLQAFDELLVKAPPATWRAYLRWKLLASAASQRALPRAFVDEQFRFQSASFTGATELQPRWKHCVTATDAALGEALGQAWVRRHFGADGKRETLRLVEDVEAAMGRDLAVLPWMDETTRARAREKLAAVRNKIGYPDAWRDYDRLQVDRASFFRSLAAARAFEVQRDLSKIGRPVDRAEWLMTPPEVNAYFDPAMNEMVFPAGILQPPFYTRGAPAAVNYGAVGMVVGHELTHGFDDEGRQYGANGDLRDWWTPAASEEFDRRARCVERQYARYEAVEGETGLRLNGRLTLGENIADLGGVKLAFSAWRESRRAAPDAPVEGFTPEQAFFVGYAQAWCTRVRPQQARLRAQTDPHSPPRWRVNGPLANLPEFQQAFQCAAGSAMVRAERCEVW